MEYCPLCDAPVANDGFVKTKLNQEEKSNITGGKKKHLLSRILWQITAILLLSGITATLIINLAIQGHITWSVYPITICLVLLPYALLMAFWRTGIVNQMLGSWFLSVLILWGVSKIISPEWPLSLALPILSAINITGIILIFLFRFLKRKGLNVFAIIFLSIALLCIVIECIVSHFVNNEIKLQWSMIVAACLLPVTAAIIFMYFRTRNNNELKKIFHT